MREQLTFQFERETAVKNDGAGFGVGAGLRFSGCACVASQCTGYTKTQSTTV